MDNKFEEFDRIMREDPGFINEMGITLTELSEGYAKGRIILDKKHMNPMGTVHGGLIFALADTIGGRAAMTYGSQVVTLNSSVSFLNAAADTEYIEAEANVVRAGRTSVFDVMIRTKEGVDVAKVLITFCRIG